MILWHRITTMLQMGCTFLFACVLLLWPVTVHAPLFVAVYGPTGRPLALGIGKGSVYFTSSNASLGTDLAWSVSIRWPGGREAIREFDALDPLHLDQKHSFFRFYVGRKSNILDDDDLRYDVAGAPVWAVILPLLWISQRWLRREWEQHHRRKNGLCMHCGYDVRSTPTRCPECGLVPVLPRRS